MSKSEILAIWLKLIGFLDLNKFGTILNLQKYLFFVFFNFDLLSQILTQSNLLALMLLKSCFSKKVSRIEITKVVILLKSLIKS